MHGSARFALLGAWLAGAVLAVAAPGWPFPGAPVVILLASALAWQVTRPGLTRPSPVRLAICAGGAGFLSAVAFTAHASGRVPLSYAVAVSAMAFLMAAVACLAPARDART